MWEPIGRPVDPEFLGPLQPVEILFEFEGEFLTFLARDRGSAPLLVHNLCVIGRTSRYVVSAITFRLLADLKAGRIDLRAALHRPRCWIVDLVSSGADDPSWQVQAIRRIDFEDLPDAYLPRPGVLLRPELEASYENISF